MPSPSALLKNVLTAFKNFWLCSKILDGADGPGITYNLGLVIQFLGILQIFHPMLGAKMWLLHVQTPSMALLSIAQLYSALLRFAQLCSALLSFPQLSSAFILFSLVFIWPTFGMTPNASLPSLKHMWHLLLCSTTSFDLYTYGQRDMDGRMNRQTNRLK